MLEDPANRTTVRWGNDGDTFVVLDVCFRTPRVLSNLVNASHICHHRIMS
jgi:hypothetical protein